MAEPDTSRTTEEKQTQVQCQHEGLQKTSLGVFTPRRSGLWNFTLVLLVFLLNIRSQRLLDDTWAHFSILDFDLQTDMMSVCCQPIAAGTAPTTVRGLVG